MKNATRRVERAAKRAIAELGGLWTAGKPLVLTRNNVGQVITAVAPCVYRNPETAKYRKTQKRRVR